MNQQCLPFPLNVYARTLELEYSQLTHLHFGVFDEADRAHSDYHQAQQQAQDELSALLLPAPAAILEIGFGTGAFAKSLAAQGYQLTALSCIEEEFCAVQELGADGVDFVHSSLPEFTPEQRFDAVILQQSAQYFDPLALFAFVARVLKNGGQLLIADEFTLDDSEIHPEPRPVLVNFLQLAERCGFSVQRQRELGRQVAPGLVLFGELLRKHQSVLVAQLAIAPEQFEQLAENLEVLARKYSQIRLSYTLLDFRKEASVHPDVCFGSISAFSIDEISPLFEKSFETAFDAAIWQWKYGDGRGRAVCVRDNEKLLAHYGGAPRDILYFGEQSKALQICDVMVLPEYRSFVSRDTLFFKTAATLLEQQVGNCAEHLLGFGFPNQRVLRVAQRLGLYDVTDRFVEIDYPIPTSTDIAQTFTVNVFDWSQSSAKAQVNALWKTMANSFVDKIIGVRDWDYLQYRYFYHPLWARGDYECLELRGTKDTQLRAIVFIKPHEGGRLLMDIIGDMQQFPELLMSLRAHLSQQSLLLRSRVTQAYAQTLSLDGSKQYELGIEIPCNIWTRGPAADTLKGAWWLTAGDMDFL